jgi:hypothetical protein
MGPTTLSRNIVIWVILHEYVLVVSSI